MPQSVSALLLVTTIGAVTGGCVPLAAVEPTLRRDSARFLSCPPSQVTISEYEQSTAQSRMTWTASGCGQDAMCALDSHGDAQCTVMRPRE